MPRDLANDLRAKALRARQLAGQYQDQRVAANLRSYADDLEKEAARRETTLKPAIPSAASETPVEASPTASVAPPAQQAKRLRKKATKPVHAK